MLLFLLPLATIFAAWMAYTALRAFRIRGSVLVPSHRYQALWVGASAIFWIVTIILFIFVPFLYVLFPEQVLAAKIPIAVATIASLLFFAAFVLAWADALVPIVRASDPRNRDTLRWRYSRMLVWVFFAFEISLGTYFILPSIASSAATGVLGPVGLGVVFNSEIAPYFVIIGVIVAAVLIISYLQSPDISLRQHLKWLIAYDLVLILQGVFVFLQRSNLSTLTGSILPSLPVIATIFGVILAIDYIQALCLYKCAVSLAPVNRFPPKTVESKP